MKKISLSLIGIAILAFLIYNKIHLSGKNGAPPAPANKNAEMPVTILVVKPELLANTLITTGTLAANDEVELKSEISGKIKKILFREGSQVKGGDLLLKINDDELQAQLLKAQYREKLAQDNEYRMRMQLKLEAVAQKDYDASLNDLNAAKADAKLLAAQIAKTEIRAPFGGSVGLRYASEGSYLSPGTKITTLQNLQPVKLDFSIPERYAGTVANGQKVSFTIQGNTQVYQAEIYAREPKIDPDTRTLLLRATSKNHDNKIYSGAFAEVTLDIARNDSALLIPTQALAADKRGQKIFLFKKGHATPQPVTVGLRTEDRVEITQGLRSGDTVIVSGVILLRPDAAVKIADKL